MPEGSPRSVESGGPDRQRTGKPEEPVTGQHFDDLWLYPEVGGQLALEIRAPKELAKIRSLISAGDPEPIKKWLRRLGVTELTRRLVRLGIPTDDTGSCPMLFDEIVVARRKYDDMLGSIKSLLSRRVGREFHHRVFDDGGAVTLDSFKTDAPLTPADLPDEFCEFDRDKGAGHSTPDVQGAPAGPSDEFCGGDEEFEYDEEQEVESFLWTIWHARGKD